MYWITSRSAPPVIGCRFCRPFGWELDWKKSVVGQDLCIFTGWIQVGMEPGLWMGGNQGGGEK